MNKKIIKDIVFIGAIVLGVFLVYIFFLGEGGIDAFLNPEGDAQSNALVKDLFALSSDLNQIKLDTSVLEGEVFGSLEDRSVELEEVPRGRVNPFEPAR